MGVPTSIPPDVGERVLAAFRRAASQSSAYRALLREQGVNPHAISDLASFFRSGPVLDKRSTFNRFGIGDLAVPGAIEQAAFFLSSSGHGGAFSVGIETRRHAAAAAMFIDNALDEAFAIRSKRTLAVNCLPMGVGISSDYMAIAAVSVREDIAVGIVERLGSHYDQVLLICDPLFLPCLLMHALARGVEWKRYDTKLILGGEVFGEGFRSYAGRQLGYTASALDAGAIRSSMGVAELGLHLFYETAATILLRRSAADRPGFSSTLLNTQTALRPTPMLMEYDEDRVFVEVDRPDESGFGLLTLTLLDAEAPLPLVRYQPGDIGAIVGESQVLSAAQQHGVTLGRCPRRMIALRGRQGDVLPNGSHISAYRDALFADDDLAATITGAYRVDCDAPEWTLHIQLGPNVNPDASVEQAVLRALSDDDRHVVVRLWRYETFPFGMRLDYERKFRYRA